MGSLHKVYVCFEVITFGQIIDAITRLNPYNIALSFRHYTVLLLHTLSTYQCLPACSRLDYAHGSNVMLPQLKPC